MTLIGFFDVISPTQAQLCKPDMVDEIHPHLQQQGYDQGDQRYERTKLPLCQGQPSSNEHRCRGGGQSPRASGQFRPLERRGRSSGAAPVGLADRMNDTSHN